MGGEGPSRILVAGSANADFVVRAPHIPSPGETLLGGDLVVHPGGKGANQAVAAARGGASTAMLVALGDDDQGRMLEEALHRAGVKLHVRRSSRSTGAALITVSEAGENAITVAPGANADLRPGDLPDLAHTSWLVMQLETPIDTVQAFASAARKAATKVALNAAPAHSLPAELLASIDLLVVNEDELATLVGGHGSVIERLARTGVPMAVATLGNRGACALENGAVILQPAFAVSAVDTTGAGDTFCGVLVAALASGEMVADALQRAAAAAALSTTRPGAQNSIPSRAEVDDLLVGAQLGDPDLLALYCGAAAAG